MNECLFGYAGNVFSRRSALLCRVVDCWLEAIHSDDGDGDGGGGYDDGGGDEDAGAKPSSVQPFGTSWQRFGSVAVMVLAMLRCLHARVYMYLSNWC